jgi:hypothetical protein
MKTFKHQITLFYILKAMICFAGFFYLLLVEAQTSNLLVTVGTLSLIAAPLMYWLESGQTYTGESTETQRAEGA